MTEQKEKKKFYKKPVFWIVLVVLAIIGTLFGGDDKPDTKDEAGIETTTEEKKEIDYSTATLTTENVTELVKKMTRSEEIEAKVDGGDVFITYYTGSVLSDKSLVKENAKSTVRICEKLFSNPNTETVDISQAIDVLDEKGAESREIVISSLLSRESIEGVDWTNFYGIVSKDYTKLQGISESYIIAPFLQEAMKK